MAIFGKDEATPSNSSDRPEAHLWLNIGVEVDVPTADGEGTEKKFISFPVNLALDTMEPMVARGNNKAWNEQVAVKNKLLKFAQNTAQACEPGTGEILENIKVQAYKKATPSAPVADAENSLLKQLTGTIG